MYFIRITENYSLIIKIEKECPELVRKDDKGYLSVGYANMTAVLLQAIKEQQVIINDRQKNIKALQDNNLEQKELNNKLQVENVFQ